MSILIESGKGFYEITDDVLAKCKISKEQFLKGRKKMAGDVEGQSSDCNLVKVGCPSKASIWASC